MSAGIPMHEDKRGGPLRIGLLGATYATGNLGVSALTSGATRCLLQGFPGAEVFLLDYGKQPAEYSLRLEDREVSLPLVNLRFSKKFYLANNVALLLFFALVLRLIPSARWRARIASRNPWLRRIHEAAFFASIAGGDSFSDIYGLGRLLYVALPQLLVLACGKRLILLPQTLGPFRGRLARLIARFILRQAGWVYARDQQSLRLAQQLLGAGAEPKKLRFCYDVAFGIPAHAPAKAEIEGLPVGRPAGVPLVGLNVSGLLAMGGYTRNNMFRLQVDYQELCRRIAEYLLVEKRAHVLLVPHVFGGPANPENDVVICEKLFEELRKEFSGRVGLVRGSCNESEIKHFIGMCDLFIGSRMHACIGALSQSVPAVPIAYSDKFTGVMESVGVGALVIDPRRMGQNEILEAIGRAYDQRLVLRAQLVRKMPRVIEELRHAFEGTLTDRDHREAPRTDRSEAVAAQRVESL